MSGSECIKLDGRWKCRSCHNTHDQWVHGDVSDGRTACMVGGNIQCYDKITAPNKFTPLKIYVPGKSFIDKPLD